jgi:diguanylate cyclase (GGDEF)-like protein
VSHPRRATAEARLLLVVGDDVRAALEVALTASGFHVTVVAGGGPLPLNATPPPHLLVLDTERDGEREALGNCLAVRATPTGIEVLLLIPAEGTGVVERALDAGVTDLVVRGAPPALLLHRIRQMLRVKHAVDDLRSSETSLEAAQRIARLGNWAWDPSADEVTWSSELERLLDIPAGLSATPISRFMARVHVDDRPAAQTAIDSLVAAGTPFTQDVRFVLNGGVARVLRAQGEGVVDGAGRVVRVIGTLQDITERTATEDRIRFLAYYDTLTSLPNRVLFTERLRGMLGTARRRGQLVATIFVDLDNFKSVNDTMGHTAGDELLQAVAARFRESLRDTDVFTRDRHGPDGESSTVARLGGDEFILAIGDLERVEDVPRIARRLQDALKQPINLSFGEVVVTTSMGISVFPQDGQTVEELFKNADAALYHAKDSGRNCFQFFSSSLNEAALQRLLLEAHLRRAVQNHELLAYFQPQVDGRTDQVVAVEALMRWQRPEAGLVPPAQFIHVAEESGSIHELGRWILRTASAASVARGWASRGVRVAVNISTQQFKRPGVVETLVTAVTESGLTPDCVSLEITESVLADHDRAVPMLVALKDAGFSIILDDFGTGYSSLTYLKALPLDALKIDRSFIRTLTTDPRDRAIVTAIIGVARSLQMDVVAEGVERHAQKQQLLEMGCTVMQGYLFGRPVPVEQIIC